MTLNYSSKLNLLPMTYSTPSTAYIAISGIVTDYLDRWSDPSSAYIAISGVVTDYLERWSDEINTCCKLSGIHEHASRCAYERAMEAKSGYFALSKAREKIRALYLG